MVNIRLVSRKCRFGSPISKQAEANTPQVQPSTELDSLGEHGVEQGGDDVLLKLLTW